MFKFGRNYKLTVEIDDQGTQLVIGYPLTLELYIRRENLACAGNATFRVYNLAPTNRNRLIKGPTDVAMVRKIKLEAGYGENLSVIFDGNIREAQSYRPEGQVNFVTEIHAWDYANAMSLAFSTWTASSPENTYQRVIERLCDDLVKQGNITIGAIGEFTGNYARNPSFCEPSWEALKKVVSSAGTNASCYIDNGKIYVLNENDAFEGSVPIINSQSGLLGTPKRNQNWIELEILFEPRLKIGQKISLQSTTNTTYNGIYKVIGLTHLGVISGAVGGKLRTTIRVMVGSANKEDPFNLVEART
jgi:hypothetical protein